MENTIGLALISGISIGLKGNLKQIKEALGFETADFFYFTLEGKRFVAICDDEGLLKENHYSIYVIDKKHYNVKRVVAGNVFICKMNDYGDDYISLNDDDFNLLQENIGYADESSQKALILLD